MAKNPSVYFYLPLFLIVFALFIHKDSNDKKVLGTMTYKSETYKSDCRSLICKFLKRKEDGLSLVNYISSTLEISTK